MEHRISATELARKLGDVLGKIRYLGDSYIIERNGNPVARIVAFGGSPAGTLREALMAWRGAGPPEAEFANALEAVAAADRAPEGVWDS